MNLGVNSTQFKKALAQFEDGPTFHNLPQGLSPGEASSIFAFGWQARNLLDCSDSRPPAESCMLPFEQLDEVLNGSDGEAQDLLVGAVANPVKREILLLRGNLTTLPVPFEAFPPSGTGLKPDFVALSVTDYGQTLRLGEYEASVDAILFERDEDYRKRKGGKPTG